MVEVDSMKKCFVTPNDTIRENDSASIQAAVDLAKSEGINKVVIPKLNARTGEEKWIIAETVKLPSDMTVILEDLLYQDFYWNTWAHRNEDTSLLGFDTGSSLFLASVARDCNSLRQMEDAYGILPNPLYDEYQDQYYSQINNYRDSILSVFSTAGDPNKVAAAIELMSYYSYYEIYPSFYEVVIQGRGTRDAESREMLDIIFSNRTYDLTFVFDPFGMSDEILRFPANQNSNLASFLAARESKMESALEQLVELRDQYN